MAQVMTQSMRSRLTQGLRLGALSIGILLALPAQADVIDWFGIEQRPNIDGLKKLYVGAGLSNALVAAHAEAPTKYGNVYAKVGTFYDGEEVAGQVGWRYPYQYSGDTRNGYFLGGFIGHVESDNLNGELYNRLGAGLELSYLWQNALRSGSASVAVAAGEEDTANNGVKKRATPMLIFSVTFGLGVL
jgi:hypothetical protein